MFGPLGLSGPILSGSQLEIIEKASTLNEAVANNNQKLLSLFHSGSDARERR
jgi:hypothetical protein